MTIPVYLLEFALVHHSVIDKYFNTSQLKKSILYIVCTIK